MCSNPKKFLRLVFAAMFFVTGCGLNTGEKAPTKTPPSYSGKGYGCVGRIPEHFEKYVNDNLSVEEINEFMGCLQNAFTTFASMTRGRNATSYQPDEIRRFLHEFFLGERRISDKLLNEFMVLKQTMVGGAADSISREELYAAVAIIEELRDQAVKLKPHLQILNPRLAKKQDPATLGKRLGDANEALNSAIQVVSARLAKSQRNYSLGNLQNLLTEFRIFAGWEMHFSDAIPIAKWINFLRVFREMTMAPPDPQLVRPVDWAPMFQSFTRWYLVYLQFQIGVKDQPVLRGVGLQNSVQLAQEVFSLLEQSAGRQPGMTIGFEQLDELVDTVEGLRWLPPGIRGSSVKSAMHSVVTRVLGDAEIPASKRKSEGLDLKSISRARDLFFKWAYIQMDLANRVSGAPEDRVVPNIQLRPYMTPDIRAKIRNMRSSEWDDFNKVTEMQALFADGSYRVGMTAKEDRKRYNMRHGFHNLSMMNIFRTLSALLFRGYAEQAGSRIGWDSGISLKEMEQFYADFREIGIDVKLVDSRNKNMGGRDYKSGNLFTYSSDGLVSDGASPKARLSMAETMELFAFLFSGGETAKDFYAELNAICAKGPLDIHKRPKLERGCVIDALPFVFDKTLANMPDLLQFLRVSPLNDRKAYARTMLETAFSPATSDEQWVEFSEMTSLSVILHYAESVMTRYDRNRDATLTNPEIEAAAAIFVGFIQNFWKEKKGQDLSEARAKAAFYYILTYRKMPTGYSDIAYMLWISYGDLKLNRADLSAVFRVIIAQLFTPPPPAPEPAPEPVVPCQGADIVIPAKCNFAVP